MKRLTTMLAGLGTLTMLAFAAPAWSTIIPVEGAVEAVALEVYLRDDLTGHVAGRSCETCERKSFPITPDTRAFVGKDEVDLRDVLDQRGKPATIIYNLESGRATKIAW